MCLDQSYTPSVLEPICQEEWQRERRFSTPVAPADVPCAYVYACTPFTTGSAHMGHVRSYTIADVHARRARAAGRPVLWAMGFDSFGLPNEMAAVANDLHPGEWVARCAATMERQFTRLGLSVDWSRRFVTSDPEYYRWTQWVFLRFFERGLVHRSEGIEYWCENCQTTLASLQVVDNNCWRCGQSVTLKCVTQWYLRFSPYAEELWNGLEHLAEWDSGVVQAQRHLIGRVQGVELLVPRDAATPLTVFTPYPDSIHAAAFIAISPNDPYVDTLSDKKAVAQDLSKQKHRHRTRAERAAEHTLAIRTSLCLRVPGLSRDLPVVITPDVDARFGGGASLGIPSVDSTDALIAESVGIAPTCSVSFTPPAVAPATRYRLRDVSISRRRHWAAPIPIVHCGRCGEVPVPDQDLPVLMPDVFRAREDAATTVGPSILDDCRCPACGNPAMRDQDTLDVHFDSIWMLIPFCVPPAARDRDMFTHADLGRWLPVHQVVCGVDQAGWWMNDRLCFKVLSDCGYFPELPHREPVRKLLMHDMVLAGGRKMSKSAGNAVDPIDIIDRYGADVLRLAVLRVQPRKAFNWTSSALDEQHAFLADVWSFVGRMLDEPSTPCPALPRSDPGTTRFNRQRARAIEKINRAYDTDAFHLVIHNLKWFFDATKQFANSASASGLRHQRRAVVREAVRDILTLLEPVAPHASYALLRALETVTRGSVDAEAAVAAGR